MTIRQLLGAVCLSCAVSADAAATPVLDQVFEPSEPFIFAVVFQDITQGQTFTVGSAGQLTSIDLFLRRYANTDGDLIVDVRGTQGGAPIDDDGLALASVVVPLSTVSDDDAGWVSVDLSSAALSVVAGDMLAVTLRSPASQLDLYEWYGSLEGTYAGGGMFTRKPSGIYPVLQTPLGGDNFDLSFRTYVEAGQPVPEPTSILLVGAGAVGMGVRRFRRRDT